jgi:hypothetical protein
MRRAGKCRRGWESELLQTKEDGEERKVSFSAFLETEDNNAPPADSMYRLLLRPNVS